MSRACNRSCFLKSFHPLLHRFSVLCPEQHFPPFSDDDEAVIYVAGTLLGLHYDESLVSAHISIKWQRTLIGVLRPRFPPTTTVHVHVPSTMCVNVERQWSTSMSGMAPLISVLSREPKNEVMKNKGDRVVTGHRAAAEINVVY